MIHSFHSKFTMTFTVHYNMVQGVRTQVKSSSPPGRRSQAFLDRCSALPILHHAPKGGRPPWLPCGVRERERFSGPPAKPPACRQSEELPAHWSC